MIAATLWIGLALFGQLRQPSDFGSRDFTTAEPRFTPRREGTVPTQVPYRQSDPSLRRTDDDIDRRRTDNLDRLPTRPIGGRIRPPQIVAEALSGEADPNDRLPGEPMRLVDALRRVRDRAAQIKVTQVYWRLAMAQADYHFACEGLDRLREASRGQLELPALRAARCAARGLKRDSEVAILRAQNDLATQLALPSNAAPPLVVDQPLVSEYRTEFDRIYAGRTPPPRAFLIDRTLPIRLTAIEEHAEAILASQDATDATTDEYLKGGVDLTTLLSTFERLWKERKAFTSEVREYNQDIAEYAMTAAAPNTSEDALVGMLIKTAASPRSSPPQDTVPFNRGSAIPPSAPGTTGGVFQFVSMQRLLDAPRDIGPPSSGRGEMGLATTDTGSAPLRRLRYDDEAAQRSTYSALVNVDTPLRTQRLNNSLHFDRILPERPGRAVTLSESLSMSPRETLRDVIEAYWRARENAAKYQSLRDAVDQYEGLSSAPTRLRQAAGGPEAVLRLSALRRSARAAVREAHIDLLRAQFDLTSFAGQRLDGDWLFPATVPHGGRYQLRLDLQPPEMVAAGDLERRGSLVPALHQELEDYAGAVVYVDAARAVSLEDPAAGPAVLDSAGILIDRQAAHTSSFLRTITRYNLAIADYVLAGAGGQLPGVKLVEQLVVVRRDR